MCIGRAKTKCIRRLIKDNRRHDKRVNKKKRWQEKQIEPFTKMPDKFVVFSGKRKWTNVQKNLFCYDGKDSLFYLIFAITA